MRPRLGILTGIATEAEIAADLDSADLEAIIGRSAADPEKARREAARLVDLGAQAILSFGLAGGLAPSLDTGALVVGSEVALADGTVLPADPHWRAAILATVQAEGVAATAGRLYGSQTLVTEAVEKRALAALSGAIAVDMESGAAALAAAEAGLPFAAIRAISDRADRDLPAIATMGLSPDGRVKPLAAFRALVTRPGEWGAVLRLARDSRAAFATLRRVVGRGGGGGLLPP